MIDTMHKRYQKIATSWPCDSKEVERICQKLCSSGCTIEQSVELVESIRSLHVMNVILSMHEMGLRYDELKTFIDAQDKVLAAVDKK